jgi:PLP dependent protein
MSVQTDFKLFLHSIPSRVKVVAVSKTQTTEAILEIYRSGHKIFGENKIQELISKKVILPNDIEWHMIGHLQTNKVKYIAPFVSLIHSVDSLKLLDIINNEGIRNNRIIEVMLQVHIAEEQTKYGLSRDELFGLLSSPAFQVFKNVRIRGLMGMATFTQDSHKIRSEFRHLVKIFGQTKDSFFRNMDYFSEISMGMSNDYKIAIEEGSTMIRIGSLIFGERNY